MKRNHKKVLLWLSVFMVGAMLLPEWGEASQRVWLKQSLNHFLPILYSFLIVICVTPVMIRLAHRFDYLDYPDKRKMHDQPVALLGGAAIFIGFISIALLYVPWSRQTSSIILAASLLLIVGTIDDVKPLSSTVRLIVQLIASLLVISSGLVVSFAPETIWGRVLGMVITVIWIIGITNAFNFSDGIDGLASGISFIASIFFFFMSLKLGQISVAMITAITAGCSLGFLWYNFKPAKIYLGDGGSTFLGFLLACFALYGGWSERGPVIALGIPTLILGVLIYDMCYITVSRVKNGLIRNVKEWLDFTGKDHFHHRLIHLGFSVQYAVLFIYVLCITLGLSALTLARASFNYEVIIFLIQAGLIFTNITMIMLAGRRLYLPKDLIVDVLSEREIVMTKEQKFISGETLKKILHGKYDDDKIALDSILDAYVDEHKERLDQKPTNE